MTKTVIKVDNQTFITQLIASEGMVLTNDEAYGKEIYLGVHDLPENWHEITNAEYEDLLVMQTPDPNMDLMTLQQKAAAYDVLMGVSK